MQRSTLLVHRSCVHDGDAGARAPAEINTADTAWRIAATALLMMMTTPGLSLIYSGMVRKKNVLATMAQSLAVVTIVSILWVAFGYSLSFGDGPWLGNLDRAFLAGMTMDSVNPAAKTIPEALFMLSPMTFAIITVARPHRHAAVRRVRHRLDRRCRRADRGPSAAAVDPALRHRRHAALVGGRDLCPAQAGRARRAAAVSKEQEMEGLDITQHGEALQ